MGFSRKIEDSVKNSEEISLRGHEELKESQSLKSDTRDSCMCWRGEDGSKMRTGV